MIKDQMLDSMRNLSRDVKSGLIAAIARLPDGVQDIMFKPEMRSVLRHLPLVRAVYTGCFRAHPLDRQLGTDTSGIVVVDKRDKRDAHGKEHHPYMGSQPSIVRRALRSLGDIENFAFMDIGCGKGRALIIASEFPFAAVCGYDISAPLVAVARENALIVARRFPDRKPITVFEANAAHIKEFARHVVIYLFNPFGAEPLAALLERLHTGLRSGEIERLFIIYIVPTCAELIDASPLLTRRFSGSMPYEPAEIGYGSEEEHSVIIWESTARSS